MPDADQYRLQSGTSRRCVLLDPAERALADQFYRLHGSQMKTRPAHKVWAIRGESLQACLCLQPIANGHWLTSLFVDPALRGQGLAGYLLEHACASLEGSVWLFCHPGLEHLYARHGFAVCPELPESLASKLQRYQRNKALIALWLNG
ncbi:GNAT family N-acetyltransferase [Halopseudomonas sp.]|uniref:GNAT family N-acetyltransferase n=1 Tax=Halopseudomonas sp. TaxID=2901191 RepID=UPI0035679880